MIANLYGCWIRHFSLHLFTTDQIFVPTRVLHYVLTFLSQFQSPCPHSLFLVPLFHAFNSLPFHCPFSYFLHGHFFSLSQCLFLHFHFTSFRSQGWFTLVVDRNPVHLTVPVPVPHYVPSPSSSPLRPCPRLRLCSVAVPISSSDYFFLDHCVHLSSSMSFSSLLFSSLLFSALLCFALACSAWLCKAWHVSTLLFSTMSFFWNV